MFAHETARETVVFTLINTHIAEHVHYIIRFSVLCFFNSVIRHFQDYFSSYETHQSVGGTKTGVHVP